MLLNQNDVGFKKKGGLFTEFANKNCGVIEMNKRNDKEKKIKESEENLLKTNCNKEIKFSDANADNLSNIESKPKLYSSVDLTRSKKSILSNKKSSNGDKAKQVIESNNLLKLQDLYKSSSPKKA